MDLSVVIPALNEAAALPALLADLRAQRNVVLQIVVADGGSTDGTPDVAARAGATVVNAPRGRARQMNAGAQVAQAELLLFLHADSRLESATLLREAIDAFVSERLRSGSSIAGHWPLRFARAQPGRNLFYRYVEAKSALGRPGTINGDQGLLITAAYLAELGGFDQRTPFLEDQRIAARVFETGQWLLLPGTLTTSARRFETEGALKRYTLMSLIMGMHAAGAEEFFAHAREIYATQDATGRLRLGPPLALAWRALRQVGWRRALVIVLRAGRYTRQNSWQLFFWWDVALRRDTRPCLRFHDTFFTPLTNNAVCDAITAVLIAAWFLVVLPLACALIEPQAKE